MCGICGIFNLQLQPLAHGERIDAMAQTLFLRGPDSGGKFQLPHIALAIRRLSIIDLETGNQPLSNEAGDITLVFNGEIYNYRELCQGLLERGHHFKTHSDGEAIIHLYEEQGPGLPARVERHVRHRPLGSIAPNDCCWRATGPVRNRSITGATAKRWCSARRSRLCSSTRESAARLIPPRSPIIFSTAIFPARAAFTPKSRSFPAAHRMVVENGNIAHRRLLAPAGLFALAGAAAGDAPPGARFGGRTRRAPAAGGGIAPGERRSPGRLPERRRGFLRHRRHHERAESGKRQFVFRELSRKRPSTRSPTPRWWPSASAPSITF